MASLSQKAKDRLLVALADPTAYSEINTVLGLTADVTAGTVTASSVVVVDSSKDISAFHDITLESINFTGATGACEMLVTDNLADALSIGISGGNTFIIIDTTNSNEKLTLGASGQKIGFYGTTPAAQAAAMTAQLTTITFNAPGTPDYAIQGMTNTGPFGFVTADEGDSVMKVIANLQARMAEVEAILEGVGLCAAN